MADDTEVKHPPSGSTRQMMMAQGEACHLVRDYLAHFANPLRLRILCSLLDGRASVTELVTATGARQPAVSQQLNLLRLAGIVLRKQEGSCRYYQIADPVALEMMEDILVIAEKLWARRDQSGTPEPDE